MSCKIVHISFTDIGGAGLCAYRICKSQRELGLDSCLIVLNKNHKDKYVIRIGTYTYFFYRVLRKVRKFLHFYSEDNLVRNLSLQFDAAYSLPVSHIDLTSLQILKDADVIHLHWVNNILDYPSFFNAFKDKHIVWTLHDENLFHGISHYSKDALPDNPLERKYYEIKYNSIRQVNHLGIVFLSKMLQEKFGKHEMIAGNRRTVIHNSVDTNLFIRQNKHEARQRLGIPDDIKLFAFCAINIFDKRKGLKVLSETLADINPEYKIVAIGENTGNHRGQIYNMNVMETGPMTTPEKISWIMSAADYFVMPSYQEAFAQTPMEAMACGLPVIAFPCSGTEELITPENGIRCEDFTHEALEAGIRQALQCEYNPDSIRQDMINRFSPEKIAKDYIKFYNQML